MVGLARAKSFPARKLFTIDDVFGGWTKAQATHFSDAGTFDQIQRENMTARKG